MFTAVAQVSAHGHLVVSAHGERRPPGIFGEVVFSKRIQVGRQLRISTAGFGRSIEGPMTIHSQCKILGFTLH